MYDELMQMRWCYAEEKEGSRRSVSLPYTMHHNFTYTHTHIAVAMCLGRFSGSGCVCVLRRKNAKKCFPPGRQ